MATNLTQNTTAKTPKPGLLGSKPDDSIYTIMPVKPPGNQVGIPKNFSPPAGGSMEAIKPPAAPGYTPAQGTAAQMDPAKYNATTSDVGVRSTVQGQLDNLLSSNSPYLQRAALSANQQSNARGFLNSSMAIGNAQGALIDRALPIAQQDASTFDMRERTNQDALNQAAQFNAANRQQASQYNAGARDQMTLANQNADNRAMEFNLQQAQAERLDYYARQQQVLMQRLDEQTRMKLVELETRMQGDTERDKVAAQAYMQSMDAMGAALGNSALSADQQTRAVTEIQGQLAAFLDFNALLRDPNANIANAKPTISTAPKSTATQQAQTQQNAAERTRLEQQIAAAKTRRIEAIGSKAKAEFDDQIRSLESQLRALG